MSEMKKLFDLIVSDLERCRKDRDFFRLRDTQFTVTTNNNPLKGANLLDNTTTINNSDEEIIINEVSKDMCRTFQINPDRNHVTVEYISNGKTLESKRFSWDDKM
jgi:hypothetical protein